MEITRTIQPHDNGQTVTISVRLYQGETFCDLAQALRQESRNADMAYMVPHLCMDYLLDIYRARDV